MPDQSPGAGGEAGSVWWSQVVWCVTAEPMARKRKKLLPRVRGFFDSKAAPGNLASRLAPSAGPQGDPPPKQPQAYASAGLPDQSLPYPAAPALASRSEQPLGQPIGAPQRQQSVQSLPGLEVTVTGDILRVWRTGEVAPPYDPPPVEVARDFLVWLEQILPARKFVSVGELGLLYSVFCSMLWGRQRYSLSPLILKHLGPMTCKRQKDVRSEGRLHRNRVHYLVGPNTQAKSAGASRA